MRLNRANCWPRPTVLFMTNVGSIQRSRLSAAASWARLRWLAAKPSAPRSNACEVSRGPSVTGRTGGARGLGSSVSLLSRAHGDYRFVSRAPMAFIPHPPSHLTMPGPGGFVPMPGHPYSQPHGRHHAHPSMARYQLPPLVQSPQQMPYRIPYGPASPQGPSAGGGPAAGVPFVLHSISTSSAASPSFDPRSSPFTPTSRASGHSAPWMSPNTLGGSISYPFGVGPGGGGGGPRGPSLHSRRASTLSPLHVPNPQGSRNVSPGPVSPISTNKDAAAVAAANKGMQIKAKKHVVRVPLEHPLEQTNADDRIPSIWTRKPLSPHDWPDWIDVRQVEIDTMEREERHQGLPPTIDSLCFRPI
jgi:hypothetical protein